MADTNRPAASAAATTPAAPTTEDMLAKALAALADSQTKIANLMERQTEFNEFSKRNAPKKKTTMREFTNKHPQKRLLHPVFQNGREVNPSGLSVATIEKLDTLASGHYADGLVDVVRIKDGAGGLHSRIHILYNNKHEAQRMVFYMRFPTFTKLVDEIAAEMAVLAGEKGTPEYNPAYAPVMEAAPHTIIPEIDEEDEQQ